MLIDDLREHTNIKIDGIKVNDAVVFRVNESHEAYALASEKDGRDLYDKTDNLCFPQLLPYKNMVLVFSDDVLLWFSESNHSHLFTGRDVVTTMITGFTRDHVKYAHDTPDLFMILGTEKDTRQFLGFAVSQGGVIHIASELSGQQKAAAGYTVLTLLHLLNFLSCKNVRAVDVCASDKLQKNRRKKGKLPLVTYKTLELCDSVTIDKSGKKGIWSNRVHLCRGHMAEYGMNGKGKLFGKLTGRYWIPPHVKGNKELGMVVKDYAIKKGRKLKHERKGCRKTPQRTD